MYVDMPDGVWGGRSVGRRVKEDQPKTRVVEDVSLGGGLDICSAKDQGWDWTCC